MDAFLKSVVENVRVMMSPCTIAAMFVTLVTPWWLGLPVGLLLILAEWKVESEE